MSDGKTTYFKDPLNVLWKTGVDFGVFILLGSVWLLAVSCGNLRPVASGRLIDADGQSLYFSTVGTGRPTVVMECGLDDGGSSGVWGSVPAGVAKFTEACLYDRAGLGKSAPGLEPRTSTRIANELHSLLQQVGCQAPYILVGHSFGGLHLRRFVDLYPEEVAGLVLVDPTPRELMVEPLKAEQIEGLKAVGAPPGLIAEADGGVASSLSEWANLKLLPDVPLVVITSSPPKTGASDLDKQRYESLAAYHQGLVDMVSDGVHLTAAKAGHYIQLEEPGLVIDAIRQVFDKISIKSE